MQEGFRNLLRMAPSASRTAAPRSQRSRLSPLNRITPRTGTSPQWVRYRQGARLPLTCTVMMSSP